MGCRFLTAAGVLVMGLGSIGSAHATSEAVPTWAGPLASLIETPDSLSTDEQSTCEARVLEALNHEFGLKLDASDVAPVQAPGWAKAERGFIRGGGYNIRVLVAGLDKTTVVKMGRYEGSDKGHKDSLVGSLHVPGEVNGVSIFNETTDASTGEVTFDLTAHIDSAYAYTPWGLIDHFFTDVVGADTRDPCPASGDW